ncbi:MAG: sensor domain-containing diguanylate cyclase [Acidiferrobacter sp.]
MEEIIPPPSMVWTLDELPASPFAQRLAAFLVFALCAGAIICLPMAERPEPVLGGVIGTAGMVICITELLTAYLLMVQGAVAREPTLAFLAATYAAGATLAAGNTIFIAQLRSDSAAWLWVFWHVEFALGIVIYALLPRNGQRSSQSYWRIAWCGVVSAVGLAIALTALAMAQRLPVIMVHGRLVLGAGGALVLVIAVLPVAVLLWRRLHTILGIWLFVAAVALALDVVLILAGKNRYVLGWYAARADSVVSAVLVLAAFFHQMNRLYIRLLHAQHSMAGVNAGLVAANSVLALQLEKDDLTGLLSRRAILRLSQAAFKDRRRAGGALCLLIIDLDHFRHVNNRLGHLGGDDVLRQVCIRIRGALRQSDSVGRYGGEEFIALLPTATPATATIVADNILNALRSPPFQFGDQSLTVTASIGVAAPCAADVRLEQVIERADRALYAAKARGRDQWVMAADD